MTAFSFAVLGKLIFLVVFCLFFGCCLLLFLLLLRLYI